MKWIGMRSKISGINCLLELGNFTKESIEANLIKPQAKFSPNESIEFLAKSLIGTASIYESSLENLPNDFMRVRFSSFDCITFIYTLLAICGANTFAEFIEKLYTIRYVANKDKWINNHAIIGNFFHYVCDSLLINAAKRNYIKNITTELVETRYLTDISVFLKAFRRDKKFDPNTLYIKPEYGERIVNENFILSENIEKIDHNKIKSGDLVLFSRGEHLQDGTQSYFLIGHLGLVIKENDQLFLLHVTRNCYWKPNATTDNPQKVATGIYYLDDPRHEQIGVGYATKPIDSIEPLTLNNVEKIFFYSPEERYALKDYSLAYFRGISIWRPL